MLAALVLIYKPISIGSLTTSAAALISPIVFVLGDVIAEVYGYSISKKVLIYALICQFIFCLLTTSLIHLPSPATWQEQHSFYYVMHGFLRTYFSVVIAYFVANIINLYLISKWKAILHGRYFWIRSIGASGIGETIYSVITGFIIFYGFVFGKELVIYVLMLCFFKYVGTTILAFPANLVTDILKKTEGVKNCSTIDFNPFAGKSKESL